MDKNLAPEFLFRQRDSNKLIWLSHTPKQSPSGRRHLRMKNSYLTVTDQFCGAGGSSQGVHNLAEKSNGGLEVKLALNHWKLAIATHNTNFPDTLHDCTDISAADPRRYPSTDILITSPECTNHTLAKGTKRMNSQIDLFNSGALDSSADRSRATMWDVPRFAEYHNYNAIIVENVVDAHEWIMFDAWLHAMHLLGYKHECVYLNSMFFFPTPQSRDRMYIVFWKKGNKKPMLDFQPVAHCPKCETDIQAIQRWKNPSKLSGKYRTQYTYVCPSCASIVTPYYYAAFNCIDWSDLGTRIGDRKKPLNDNTIKRIEFGLKKYGNQSLVVNNQQSTGIGFRVKGIDEMLPTIATAHQLNLVTPFIIKAEHMANIDMLRKINDPFQTQTTRQSMALVLPGIVEMNRTGNVRASTEPLSTVLAGGNHHGLITTEAYQSFISYFYAKPQASGINEAIGTVSTRDRFSLVNFQTPQVDECYFRMLRPQEVKLAMAFNKSYIVLGTQKEQVKQLGNAVTPPVMEYLVGQVVNSLN